MASLRKPEYFWPIVWGGLLVVLAAAIVVEHYFGQVTVGEGPRPPARIVEAKLLPPFSLPSEGQAAPETVARPLFVPTRRPSPPASVAAASSMKRGQFVLTGVTLTPDAAFVFLKEVATGKTQSIRKGLQVNGLTVETVEPRRVVLRQADETEELALNIQVPPRVAAAPAPSTAVPGAPGAPGVAGVPPGPPTRMPVNPATGPVPPGSGAPAPAPAAQGAPATPQVPAPATGRRRPWINPQ